jgi:phage/plasmid-associated DNA primase
VSDQACVDRFKLVPYLARVVQQPTQPHEIQRDPEYVRLLQTQHLNELFRWMVQGAVGWYQNGRKLQLPQIVMDATGDYITEPDSVACWIEESCLRQGSTNRTELFGSYQQFCIEAGADAGLKKQFYLTLGKKGFRAKMIKGSRMFEGLQLNEEF